MFTPRNVMFTKRVTEEMNESSFAYFIGQCYAKYLNKDWGEVTLEDWHMND